MKTAHLPWYRIDRRPDGVHCDRNECQNLATVTILWPRYSGGGYRACRYHASWWAQHTGQVTARLDR